MALSWFRFKSLEVDSLALGSVELNRSGTNNSVSELSHDERKTNISHCSAFVYSKYFHSSLHFLKGNWIFARCRTNSKLVFCAKLVVDLIISWRKSIRLFISFAIDAELDSRQRFASESISLSSSTFATEKLMMNINCRLISQPQLLSSNTKLSQLLQTLDSVDFVVVMCTTIEHNCWFNKHSNIVVSIVLCASWRNEIFRAIHVHRRNCRRRRWY